MSEGGFASLPSSFISCTNKRATSQKHHTWSALHVKARVLLFCQVTACAALHAQPIRTRSGDACEQGRRRMILEICLWRPATVGYSHVTNQCKT